MNLRDRQSRRMIDARRAEDAVVDYLQAQGYDIVARNLKLGHLEVDVVARRDGVAAMVEVRTRGPGALEGPLASIAGKKKMRLLYAADRLWRMHLKNMPGVERMRIDVAAVTFGEDGAARVEHIPGAITA